MSFDFRIAYPCPHEIVRELSLLASDGRTLTTTSTVVGTPHIFMDGIEVPSGGLQTPAKLRSSKEAPYRIYSDATEVHISSVGISHTLVFPVGYLDMKTVSKLISGAVPGITASGDGGYLVLEDTTSIGRGSFVSVTGPGAPSLGFSGQASARGRQIAPPWVLGTDPASPSTTARPVFVRSPRRVRARWEVTYRTPPSRCRRCMTSRVENDLRVDYPTGHIEKIRDESALYQTCMKALLTEYKSNSYHPWYGSQILNMLGKKRGSGVEKALEQEIRRVLDKVQALQGAQMRYQQVSLKETLSDVVSVSAKAHPDDPTTVLVDIIVRNASSNNVRLTFVFTVPGVSGVLKRNGRMVGSLG
jgi:hypothetical protein